MSDYKIYSLVLAVVVFFVLALFFGIMVSYMTKMAIKLIRYGDDDKVILKERKYITKKPSKASKFERVFSAFISLILIAVFVLALCISCTDNKFDTGLSSLKIVKSDSMATKNEENEYLFENDLNDQFGVFDLVVTRPLPKEDELELYDIVVYERDGILVIHRITEIEEPNSKHSERYFKTQGDAISRHDIYPVLYSQMHAIYEGERIPYVGSIITFIQSPAGWLCFILVMFAILVMPIIEKKLLEEMRKRLAVLDAQNAVPVMAEPVFEESGIESETEESIPVPEKELESPYIPTIPKRIPTLEYKQEYDYTPITKTKLIEEKPRETIVLEKRKVIAPSYNVKPLEISAPKLPEPIRISGPMAKNDNMRCHIVPIILDNETSKDKVVTRPITRFVKIAVTDNDSSQKE